MSNIPVVVATTSLSSDNNTPQVTSYVQNTNNNDAIPVYATPINNDMNYHIPIYAEAVQPVPSDQQRSIYHTNNNNTIIITRPELNIITPTNTALNETLARVLALSKSLRCLTIIDLITVIIGSIFSLFWVFFLWGPLTGYYGVTRHNRYFIYCYVIYWVLRIIVDVLYIFTGLWWHIISLIVDLYILRYVRIHILLLKTLTEEQLQILRQYQQNNHNEGTSYNYTSHA